MNSVNRYRACIIVAHSAPLVSAGLALMLRATGDWDVQTWDGARPPQVESQPILLGDAAMLGRALAHHPVSAPAATRMILVLGSDASAERQMAEQVDAQVSLSSNEKELIDTVQQVAAQHPPSNLRGDLSSGLPRYRLRRALDYIQHHYQDDIGFEDVASHVGMSAFHFSRLFKQSMGESPHKFIMRCRIDAARRMLLDSDKTISDIAFEVGYRSQSYFTTRFALLTGMSPAAYRANN
jgi:AraC-like DNA-binding protein